MTIPNELARRHPANTSYRGVASCRIHSADWPASGWQVCWAQGCVSGGSATRTLAAGAGRGAVSRPAPNACCRSSAPARASHIDLWDYKPALEKHHGQPLPGEENAVTFQGKNGNLMKSPWPFAPAGQSGKMISTLLPNMARHVDDIAFIHSMQSKTNTHGPGCVFMNTGSIFEGFPAAGAWVGYALGSENENLPAYVAIPDIRGEPPNGKANWSNGFLPAQHQAVVMAAQQPIRNLASPAGVSADEERATRDFLRQLNEEHAAQHPGLSELRAASMPMNWPRGCSFPRRRSATWPPNRRQRRELYGIDDPNPLKAAYARNCLLARRLLERGVRYVNLYCASRASGVDGL